MTPTTAQPPRTTTRTQVEAARAEHKRLAAAYTFHVEHRCPRVCGIGGLCQRGADLLLNADAAGERWRIAADREAV